MTSKLPLVHDLEELYTLLDGTEKSTAPEKSSPQITRTIELLRKKIPKIVLSHFDRMRLRGKKPIAPVRNAVCMACHLQIPRGHYVAMQRSSEIDICDNCGTFVYLEFAGDFGSE
jgi:predicted  nucleic acid-binding Zn-ribbon protein